MYCSIIRKKEKRKPYRSRIFRDPDFSDPSGVTGKDEIERDTKDKWRVLLNKSFRRGGKIYKKQWYVCTVSYWGIIDDKYEQYEDTDMGFAFTVYERIEKHFPDLKAREIKDIYAMTWAKFEPIRRSVLEEYRNSEEYKYRVIQEEKKLKKERKKERKREYKYYEYEYKDDSFEATNRLVDDSEKTIAEKIIKKGFRGLAVKYHPDTGGDKQKMQELNRIKDKLLHNIEIS